MTNSIEITEQESQSQNSQIFSDCLYCEEKCWDYEQEKEEDLGPSIISPENDFFSCFEDDEDQLFALFSKEEKAHFSEGDLDANKLLVEARREALEWMINVKAYHNFSVITLVLGVNYFDKFMLSFGFQRERPWMTQLVAVACLSLASKIEETHVPLLLELQVECKYIFEAKTIQKMELLVLSTLDWKMNPVTPVSYFVYLVKRLKLKTHMHWEILHRCESLILSAIFDPRFLCYVSSVLATATMLLTLKELGLWSPLEHHIHLVDTLKLSKDKVEECYIFIQQVSSNKKAQKRKCLTSATRPNQSLHGEFSESSKESSISVGPPPEPLPKRSRALGPHCCRQLYTS